MTREDKKEILIKGLFLALMLIVSTLIYLVVSGDVQHLLTVRNFIVPILAGYCLLGMFIRWMAYRSTLMKKQSGLFSGIAGIYWMWIFMLCSALTACLVPQFIRNITLINVVVLLLIWLADFLYMRKVAKELNSELNYSSRMLVEDLPAKPKTEDSFIQEIQNYCNKNNLSLEIIEYGIPAKIKMNNVLYTAQLGHYYTVVGSIVFTLEFRNIVSKIDTNLN